MPDRVNSSVFEAAPLTERLARAASSRSSVFEAAPLAGVGLKIERDVSGRGFRVTGVAPDGAAGKSGLIKVNDFLIAVDSVVVKDKSTTEAANLLKGPEGSKVQMQLQRSDGKIQVVSLIRTAVARQGKATVTDSARTASRAPEKNVAVKDDKISLFGLKF
jgi:C-terminal processing protease CtpA/Prc